MKTNPLLTIGIPTFNRANHLDGVLNWIYGQIGNNSKFEVLISDNASTDNTEEVVKKYLNIYDNLLYHKQVENVGFDRNLITVMDLARGEYIKFHGDDDFLTQDCMNYITNVILAIPDVDLFYMNSGMYNQAQFIGEGYDQYLKCRINSMNMTAITIIVVRNSACRQIENKEKYIGSEILQVYIQMEILKRNPKFCMIGGVVVVPPVSQGGRRQINIGEIFIKSYFGILSEYIPYGLSEDALKFEKKYCLETDIAGHLITEIRNRQSGRIDMDYDRFEEYYINCYKDEEYFEEKLKYIRHVEASTNSLK
ncbi:glycosyltransferase family 2 protein [Romboutsia sp.]|uniref:glycosyltransferase family 2 protein n=1 Tax=Romboutsia sp. TaxID=1965302 RepID=UPI003F40BB42